MNQYYLIRRLRGPAILLLIGTLALAGYHGRHPPLLAFVLAAAAYPARRADAGRTRSAGCGRRIPDVAVLRIRSWRRPSARSGVTPPQEQSTSIVPAPSHDFGKDPDGGQS